jgi:hypothetical protein
MSHLKDECCTLDSSQYGGVCGMLQPLGKTQKKEAKMKLENGFLFCECGAKAIHKPSIGWTCAEHSVSYSANYEPKHISPEQLAKVISILEAQKEAK